MNLPKQGDTRVMFDIESGVASLTALEDGRDWFSSVSYLRIQPRVAIDRRPDVSVDLGPQGTVDAKFVERSRERGGITVHCESTRNHRGFLVGRIDLHGIPGLDPVRKHRVEATLTEYRRTDCSKPRSRRTRQVTLGACNQGEDLLYAAITSKREAADDEAVHIAYGVERPAKGLLTVRQAIRLEKRETFSFQPDLLGATVQPGYPFSGSATFADGALTGDLAVEMPGTRKPIPIAPGSARLTTSRSGAVDAPCDFGAERLGASPSSSALPRGLAKRLLLGG